MSPEARMTRAAIRYATLWERRLAIRRSLRRCEEYSMGTSAANYMDHAAACIVRRRQWDDQDVPDDELCGACLYWRSTRAEHKMLTRHIGSVRRTMLAALRAMQEAQR